VNRWRRLGRQVGRRGDALLFLALLDVGYGLYLFAPPPDQRLSTLLRFIAEIAPLWVFGALWTVVGILCAASAFLRKPGPDRWAFAAAVGIKMLWALISLVGWAVAGLPYGWFSSLFWLVFARFVYRIGTWPEPAEPLAEVDHG